MQEFLDWLAPIWRPHPGQEKFLRAEAKTKVLACGRRWGKTDACVVQVIKVVDDCVVAEPDADVPGPTIIAIDWAWYEDFSALVVVRGFQSRVSVLEVDRKHREDWERQIAWVKGVLERHPNARLICDATGGGDSITAWLRNQLRGVSIKSFVFTTESEPKLIDGLVRAFEQRTIQLPPHADLKKELENFRATRTPSGHIKLAAKSGHYDLVMALAFAVSDLPYAHQMIMTTNPRI